jgi:hypothetical protein
VKHALLHPTFPERICWGCERYCPAHELSCRQDRVAHPIELFGFDWEPANSHGSAPPLLVQLDDTNPTPQPALARPQEPPLLNHSAKSAIGSVAR